MFGNSDSDDSDDIFSSKPSSKNIFSKPQEPTDKKVIPPVKNVVDAVDTNYSTEASDKAKDGLFEDEEDLFDMTPKDKSPAKKVIFIFVCFKSKHPKI